MQNNYSFFEYYSISSMVHRLSSIYKISSLIILVISLFFCESVVDLVVVNLYIFVMMLWSNISFRLYLSNLRIFRFILLFVLVLVSLFSWNVINGLIWTLKAFDIIIYLMIITITTSLNDMVNGIYRLLKPFKRFIDINEESLDLALNFKFFGICYAEYNRIKLSKKLRGVRVIDMSFIDKLKNVVSCIKPVLKKSVEKLSILKNNMYIKNYGVSNYISDYRLNKWKKTDTMLLVVTIMMMVVTFIY